MSKWQKYGIVSLSIGISAVALIFPLEFTDMEIAHLFGGGVLHVFTGLFVSMAAVLGIVLFLWGGIAIVAPRLIRRGVNIFVVIVPMVLVSQLMVIGGLIGAIVIATSYGYSGLLVIILYMCFGMVGNLATLTLVVRMEDWRYELPV